MSGKIPVGCLALLSGQHLGFGKGKKAKVLRGCIVLAVVLELLMENRRNFEYYRGKGWRSFRIEQDHEIYLFIFNY